MNKYSVVHSDNGLFFSAKKEMSYQALKRRVGTFNAHY